MYLVYIYIYIYILGIIKPYIYIYMKFVTIITKIPILVILDNNEKYLFID